MKAVRTNEANVTLTLSDAEGERIRDGDLPAVRALLYDQTRGQTQEDARIGYVTTWQPDDAEARRIEAGACVELTVWGKEHPPVSVGVTTAVVPERELIDRAHVDRALGHLYADLCARGHLSAEFEAPAFADLWLEAVNATRPPEAGGTGAAPPNRAARRHPDQTNGRPS